MRRTHVLMLAVTLAGCDKATDTQLDGGMTEARSHGRYLGIGVFDAGRLWAQRRFAAAGASDPAAATLADDQHVIAVVDAGTGEVRECGDMSGLCVALQPWRRPPALLPAALAKHEADLERDQQASDREGARAELIARSDPVRRPRRRP